MIIRLKNSQLSENTYFLHNYTPREERPYEVSGYGNVRVHFYAANA